MSQATSAGYQRRGNREPSERYRSIYRGNRTSQSSQDKHRVVYWRRKRGERERQREKETDRERKREDRRKNEERKSKKVKFKMEGESKEKKRERQHKKLDKTNNQTMTLAQPL